MKLLEEKDKARYTEFLEKHERCNFQQSLEWGNVKTNWIKEVVLAENENKEITREDIKKWFDLAKIECSFNEDRKIGISNIKEEDLK